MIIRKILHKAPHIVLVGKDRCGCVKAVSASMGQQIEFKKAMSSRGLITDTMQKDEAIVALDMECRCG